MDKIKRLSACAHSLDFFFSLEDLDDGILSHAFSTVQLQLLDPLISILRQLRLPAVETLKETAKGFTV
jgi:hypothetical protein